MKKREIPIPIPIPKFLRCNLKKTHLYEWEIIKESKYFNKWKPHEITNDKIKHKAQEIDGFRNVWIRNDKI